MSSNLKTLASLLADCVGIKVKDSVEDTIAAAIDKLKDKKDTKQVADQVADDVGNKVVSEQIADLYVANCTYPFWDRVVAKYLGVPDVKSWSELDVSNLRALHDEEEQQDEQADLTADDQQDISDQSIDDFLSQLSVNDYLNTCYDSDEYQCDDQCDWCDWDCGDGYYDRLSYRDLIDLYNNNDSTIKHPDSVDQLVEALDIQQRLKKAIMMRSKARMIALKRAIALKHHATPEKLHSRARKLAIRMLKNKYSGGKNFSDLTYSERERIEKIISTKKRAIDLLTTKMMPIVRKIEQERFSNQSTSEFNKL